MRELVIVIPDLYLPESADAAAQAVALPGLEPIVRFGHREALPQGWRSWLAGWLGRADLAALAPARVAAAAHPQLAQAQGTLWLAVPVHLSAGMSRVHLDHRGLLYLHPEEQRQLAQDFARDFAGSGFVLVPASPRELLLLTPGVEAVATCEPARLAGQAVNEALPRGPAAAGLRRTWAETEMWLHAHPLNQARAVPLTALWPWGALGAGAGRPAVAAVAPVRAFALDAYVRGLWQMCGLSCQSLPPEGGALTEAATGATVLVAEVGLFMQPSARSGFPEALAQLDVRYLQPALAALRAGHLEALRLIANDRSFRLGRRSRWQFWRRGRPGMEGLR
ncbi:MAG: hypothetical protein JSR36_17210 [Proteobacteria bacterium]|nr:hypothetical protein [Pseudomonadota bacterium]